MNQLKTLTLEYSGVRRSETAGARKADACSTGLAFINAPAVAGAPEDAAESRRPF